MATEIACLCLQAVNTVKVFTALNSMSEMLKVCAICNVCRTVWKVLSSWQASLLRWLASDASHVEQNAATSQLL